MDSRQIRAAVVPGPAGHSGGAAGPPAVGRCASPGRGRCSLASGPCTTRAARHQRRGPTASLPTSPGGGARPRCHHAAAALGMLVGNVSLRTPSLKQPGLGSLVFPKDLGSSPGNLGWPHMAAQLTLPFPLYSTAQMWLPATRRVARRCSTLARLEASCAPTSSSSMAARGKAAAQPPPPVRPPLPALPPRPAPAAGVAPPAWAAPTPPLRWYSCPAGETPPLPHGPGTTAPGGPLDRCTHSPFHSAPCPMGALFPPLSPRGHSPHASRKTQTHLPLSSEAWRPLLNTPLLHCFHTGTALGLPTQCLRKGMSALWYLLLGAWL